MGDLHMHNGGSIQVGTRGTQVVLTLDDDIGIVGSWQSAATLAAHMMAAAHVAAHNSGVSGDGLKAFSVALADQVIASLDDPGMWHDDDSWPFGDTSDDQ